MKVPSFGLSILLLFAPIARPQPAGTISGEARDATGAVLPDVAVSIAGEDRPLEREQKTGPSGGFRFADLPVGAYTIRFELPGFKTLLVQGVESRAGRNTPLDVVLEVATVAETVTVSGRASPFDPTSTRLDVSLGLDRLQSLPSGRHVWAVLEVAPGVVLDRFDVGGSSSGEQSLFSAAGTSWSQNQYRLNGVNATDPAALGASSTYYSFDAFEEIQVSIAGHPAEVQVPGVYLNLVVKDGGNRFRGGGSYYFENDVLQSNNLDGALRARGVSQSNRLRRYWDYQTELGGPVVRDEAWFYGQLSGQRIEPYVIGFFLPSGEPAIDATELQNALGRVSYQLTPEHRLGALYYRDEKLKPHRDAGRSRPSPETTLYQDSSTAIYQATYTGLLDPSRVLEARFALVDLFFPLGEQPELPPDGFSRIDLLTGIRSGGPGMNRVYERRRWQAYGSYSLFRDEWLAGRHDLKLGGELSFSPVKTSDRLRGAILYRDFFGIPVQVELYNDPVTAEERTLNAGFFAQDSFRRGRMVLNLGVRFDAWRAGYPAQASGAGPWSEIFRDAGMPASVPGRAGVVSWQSFAPRLGASYLLTADGKTLVRAHVGRYHHQAGTGLGGFTNPNARAAALFHFEDLDGDRLFDPGEVDLDAPLAVDLPARNEMDPDIRQPSTTELGFGIEREFGNRISLSAHLLHRRDRRLIDDVNVGAPFSAYREVTARDPGLDLVAGTDDDRALTVFDRIPASLGRDRFVLTNPEGLEGDYTGLVLQARTPFSGTWHLMSSLAIGRSTGFLPGPSWESNEGSAAATPLYDDPNSLVNAKGRTFWDRSLILRAAGSYSGFFGVELGASVRAQTGQPLYRSVVVSQTLAGAPLNQGAIEVLADRQGFRRSPGIALLDLRAEKELDLGLPGRLGIVVDVFNVLNANTATRIGQRQNLFGAILEILPPRVARIGAHYRF